MSLLTLPLFALVAGVISFSSPCCIPLLPGYISYITALPTSKVEPRKARAIALQASLSFVAGFTLVFTALGVLSAYFGTVILQFLPTIVRFMGVGIIFLGVSMMGLVRIKFLQRELRFDMAKLPRGTRGAFGVGIAFAAGWTPCLGPILAVILATASATHTVVWGAILLTIYSLGLGIPFILVALGLQRAQQSISWIRRHTRGIEVFGGLMLTTVGVMFVTGTWQAFFRPLQRIFAHYGWPPF